MRKCVSLEDEPGFQQIYSPILTQAIDRGLKGHSGTGVVDWGYDLVIPGTTPTKGGPKPTKKPPREPSIPPHLADPVITGAPTHFDNIFNRYITRVARQLINKFPKPTIKGFNSPHVGTHNAFKGDWGHIETTKGWGGTDSSTLIHEYGHALDNIIGQFLTGTDEKMQSSLQLLKAMEIDGKKLGLILDDSIYWSYLREKGISFRPDPRGKRKITITPMVTYGNFNKPLYDARFRQRTENKMHGGDHWRIMAEMLRVTKEDMNKANLSKDPVQMLRTKKWHDAVAKLYDAHIARIEKIKQIKEEARKLHRKLQKENPYHEASGDAGMFSHLGDIIDALTGGEVVDWEKANNVYFKKGGIVSTFGHHGSGYYSMRREQNYNGGYTNARNYRMETAMGSRRKEIWAQMFTFWSSHDEQFQNYIAKLLPNIHRDFTKAINRGVKFKMGSSINLNRSQSPDLSQAEIESLIDRSATPDNIKIVDNKRGWRTLYHGTNRLDLEGFSPSGNEGTVDNGLWLLRGTYFTEELDTAKSWGKNYYLGQEGKVITAKVRLNNPATPADVNQALKELGMSPMYAANPKHVSGPWIDEALTDLLIKKGFDGYISNGWEQESDGMEQTVVFNPSKDNIKIVDNRMGNSV